jgi:hypothetical protein
MCCETLFFELMTTRRESQVRCFAKLPRETGAIVLLPDLSHLLRAEMELGSPCKDLAEYVIPGNWIFNARLASGTYHPPSDQAGILQVWRDSVELKVRSFWDCCQSVYQFFPELVGIEFRDFPVAVAEARTRIAENPEFIRAVYASFDRADLPSGAPSPASLSPRWAWFRWVQCHLIAALRIFQRHQCQVPVEPSRSVLTKAEHSLHDTQYVMLATLAGAIASNDREILLDAQLLMPEVKLISTFTR